MAALITQWAKFSCLNLSPSEQKSLTWIRHPVSNILLLESVIQWADSKYTGRFDAQFEKGSNNSHRGKHKLSVHIQVNFDPMQEIEPWLGLILFHKTMVEVSLVPRLPSSIFCSSVCVQSGAYEWQSVAIHKLLVQYIHRSGRAVKNGECLGSFITWMMSGGSKVDIRGEGLNHKHNALDYLFECSTAVLSFRH